MKTGFLPKLLLFLVCLTQHSHAAAFNQPSEKEAHDTFRELPQEAPQQLAEILQGAEFQPREVSKNFIEEIWNKLVLTLRETAESAWDWLSRNLEGTKIDLGILKFLERVLGPIGEALQGLLRGSFKAAGLIAVIALLLIAVWALREFRSKRRRNTDGADLFRHGPQTPAPPDLEQLAHEGRFTELLAALRLILRVRLLSISGLMPTVTDRELQLRLPQGVPLKETFSATVSVFERMAFAGGTADNSEIQQLYRQFVQGGS